MSLTTKYVLCGALAGAWVGIVLYEVRHGGIFAAFFRGLLGK